MASRGARLPAPDLRDGSLAPVARGWDADSDNRGKSDGATMRHGASDHHRDRRDRPGDAQPEDGHVESHWREPTQGRRRGGDWEHLPGDLGSRRGKGQLPEPEWRHNDYQAARSDAPAEHCRRYKQPLHAASGNQGCGLPNPDHRLSPRVQPHASGGPRLPDDAGAARRAPPRESVTGQKRDRDCERAREYERGGERVWKSALERLHCLTREYNGERRRPDTLSEGRDNHGMQTFGAHAGRHEATATRSDPRRNAQELANTAWVYATAGHAAPVLLDVIAAEAAPRLGEFTPQNLADTEWAFAAASHPTDGSGLFGQRFSRRCEELATEFKIKDLCQLHQWALWHAGERGRSDGLPSGTLLERCRVAFGSEEGRTSRMQRHVGVALTSLGLRPEEELSLREGYSLDFVVEWRGERVGVEVDGPSHFESREPNSATRLKRRQLRHLGWRLVLKPYWEWDEVAASSQRAEEYLASRLGGLTDLRHGNGGVR